MSTSLPIPIIGVVGSRQSGKTTTVETIVRELTRKGYRAATVKHIHEPDFTIDTKGKDSWRHAQAGAHIIVSVAAKELTIIKKVDTAKYTLQDITKNCEDDTDIIVVEGLRDKVAQDLNVPKIVTAKNKDEIEEARQIFKPILAFTGPISKAETATLKIPYVDVKKEPKKLIEIIDKRIGPIIRKRREAKETLSINVNGKMLPLNPYVQKVTRNVMFAVISTLKGITIQGNENIRKFRRGFVGLGEGVEREKGVHSKWKITSALSKPFQP